MTVSRDKIATEKERKKWGQEPSFVVSLLVKCSSACVRACVCVCVECASKMREKNFSLCVCVCVCVRVWVYNFRISNTSFFCLFFVFFTLQSSFFHQSSDLDFSFTSFVHLKKKNLCESTSVP